MLLRRSVGGKELESEYIAVEFMFLYKVVQRYDCCVYVRLATLLVYRIQFGFFLCDTFLHVDGYVYISPVLSCE